MGSVTAMLILAHQGGWDEILFVLAPLLVFGGLLVMARRRVDDMDPDDDVGSEDTRATAASERPEGAGPV